jgi:hypothetical protein
VSEEQWRMIRWVPIVGLFLVGLTAMFTGDFGRALIWLTIAMALCLHLLYLDSRKPND